MAICICGAVPCEESAAGSEFGRRLDQLALCCRGLELAVQDFCGGRDDETARRLARLAAGVAEQSERLAKAATEGAPL
jgi:hypothetical protein